MVTSWLAPMRLINSLRFRVGLAFASLGAVLSILLVAGLYFTAEELGHSLMDDALRAQLESTAERHAADKVFLSPNTVSIKGYFQSGTPGPFDPPAEIANLPPGKHNVTVEDLDYRLLVADKNGYRYFMLFDTERQHENETEFFYFLSFFAVLMTLASAGGGFWLAIRIVSPVAKLAAQVNRADPEDPTLQLDNLTHRDEIGELARAITGFLTRLHEYSQREHNFTADVSHELRTPIAIVLGAAEVLEKDEELTGKKRERLMRIKRAAHDMAELTSALLLLSREPLPKLAPCNIGETIKASVEKHKHLIGKRQIQLHLALVDDMYLNLEKPLLEVVIGNLLRNAFFYTESGTVSLRLETARLTISDTGVGMPPEVLAHVFERHYKGDASSGAGVGLSLVKRICDRYGWPIFIRSEPGKGVTVEIDFAAPGSLTI